MVLSYPRAIAILIVIIAVYVIVNNQVLCFLNIFIYGLHDDINLLVRFVVFQVDVLLDKVEFFHGYFLDQ